MAETKFDPGALIEEARERAEWLDQNSGNGSRARDDALCLRSLCYMLESLGALIVAHHAAGVLDGSMVGDKCPVCVAMFSDPRRN